MDVDSESNRLASIPMRRFKFLAILSFAAMCIAAYLVARVFMERHYSGISLLPELPSNNALIPFGLIGLVSWGVWSTRWISARRYRPLTNHFRVTTSVVVPSYREDPLIVKRCLDSWLAEKPTEVVIVVDIDDISVLSLLHKQYKHDDRVRVIPFKHKGKRSALGEAVRAARGEVLIFTDSDTAWDPGLVRAITAPFADPKVGAVGTHQRVYGRSSSVWRIVADWQVNIRYLDYVPVESQAGNIACLSGRTAAYRAAAVRPNLHDLEYEIFMGRQCVAGDDGRLTWLVNKDGWKSVYQSNARAISMFPNTFRAYVKQRVRWSRNSYRCYLTAIHKGWLWKMPIATQIRVLQILLTPLTQLVTISYICWFSIIGAWEFALLGLVWLFLGRLVRSVSHLREHPNDLRFLPVVTIAIIMVALPIKLWAFFTMNTHGWLTRTTVSMGGEGQAEASMFARSKKSSELA